MVIFGQKEQDGPLESSPAEPNIPDAQLVTRGIDFFLAACVLLIPCFLISDLGLERLEFLLSILCPAPELDARFGPRLIFILIRAVRIDQVVQPPRIQFGYDAKSWNACVS